MSATTPHLKFDASVPAWIRNLTRRWVKRLRLLDWSIVVYYVPNKAFPTERNRTILASTLPDPVLLTADIWINSEAGKDEMEETVKHELLHLRYAPIKQVFTLAWDGRRRMRRSDALLLIDTKIEEMIERDCKIL